MVLRVPWGAKKQEVSECLRLRWFYMVFFAGFRLGDEGWKVVKVLCTGLRA